MTPAESAILLDTNEKYLLLVIETYWNFQKNVYISLWTMSIDGGGQTKLFVDLKRLTTFTTSRENLELVYFEGLSFVKSKPNSIFQKYILKSTFNAGTP